MNKLNQLILMMPMIMNLLMILIMMTPTKINKFHPITLLLILISLTFLICIKMNFLHQSIIPFILFLIMIGSLMVIFMYITSMANNELFIFNFKIILMNFFKIIPLMVIIIIMMIQFKNLIFNLNFFESFQMNKFTQIYKIYEINSMYKEINNKSSYFIMMYLFYSMICIMNICYKLKAPLRQLTF